MDQTIPQGGWWSRNWKWFVPVGCLSLLATCGCCIGGSVLFAANAVKGSHAYQEALSRAKADPDVQKALGTPIEAGWMTQFNANASGGEVITSARIPISGPKGEGAVFVKSTEHGQTLTFQQLDVVIGHQVIHLPGVEPGSRSPTGPEGEEDRDKGDIDLDQPDVTVESATDRPGGDYRDYEMTDADASKCALDCAGDAKCRAYTFVKPAGGKPGRCRLKSHPAPKVGSDCCVSGIKK
jgi:PAN domain-containing protein/cytochrome oxidase complex assembly protein 1